MRWQLLGWRISSLGGCVAAVLVATLLATLLRAAIGLMAPATVPFAPFILAVLVVTFLCGYAAGLAALGLGSFTAWYLFVAPSFSFFDKSQSAVASLVLFWIVGLAIVAAGHFLRQDFDRESARERRLAKAQEAGGVGDWEWDLVAGKITWSDNLFKLMGRDPATFVPSPDNFDAFVHPDDLGHVTRLLQDAIADKGRFEGEVRCVRPDGTIRHFVSRGEVVCGPSGQAERVLAVKIDITARREAEDALAKSEERYRQLFNAMSEAYVVHEIIYDEAGNAVDFLAIEANPAFEQHTGMPRDIVVGYRASEFAPGGDPEWLRLFAEVVRTGKPDRVERYSPRPQRWVDLRAFPLGGPRLGIIFNDVSERKRVEAEHEAAQARLAAAMQLAEVGAYEYDPATAIITVSGSCNAIFGFADRLTSRPLAEFLQRIYPDDLANLKTEVRRALAQQNEFGAEYRIRTPDGGVKWIASRGAAVANPAGVIVLVGAMFDITARKLAELEREAAREHTEALFREMNHRTKNNLTIVASLLNTQSAANKDNPILLRHLHAARERIMTVAELHTSLYQGSSLGEIDFGDYIKNLCAHIEAGLLSAERDIRFVVDVEPVSLSPDIAVPIGLVVNELVTNAVKHAFNGNSNGPVIAVSMSRAESELLLVVEDNGRGLPDDWASGVSGLGRRIVDVFVKQVGGEITPVPGKGARFEFRVPA
jgi:PAS domain S-box-containing protein